MSGLEVSGLTGVRGPFAVGPIDLEVPPGEAVALIGPSGAGKTTLLRLLAGFLAARTGTIRIDDRDRTASAPEERSTGYVPQGLGLFPHRSVKSNVAYPLELRGGPNRSGEIDEILARWGLSEHADAMPDRLSGGEQQRVAMARALAAHPRLLLWDEPLGPLDLVTRDQLLGTIRRALTEERVPMVLVTHDPETAFSLADRILLLDRGRSLFSGTAPEFGRHPPNGFAARFAGYLNILDTGTARRLAEGDPSFWAGGPVPEGGVCFDPSALRLAEPSEGGMAATVRRRRYSPMGLLLTVEVVGVELLLRLPPSAEEKGAPTVGTSVRIVVAPERIHRISDAGTEVAV